ncbi:hypothetical protein O181_065781 [Austropuccinia psidii MF-1]|uniref:Uncharacterized protein n=1 Tax=Austropuccinia psidii MF-1 TaxID=1389203 RepID=A0A9Q3EPM7_9BASI|nr:hypothetical protein [Austropuccinia psidii MF-1]
MRYRTRPKDLLLSFTLTKGPNSTQQSLDLKLKPWRWCLNKAQPIVLRTTVLLNNPTRPSSQSAGACLLNPILNWKSTVSTLSALKSNIEPVLSLNSLIPFGLKVFVSRQPESKVLPPSKTLLYVGPEDYSYSGQLLYPQTGKVIGSVRKPIEGLPSMDINNPPLVQPAQVATIPLWPCRNTDTPLTPAFPDDGSPPTPDASSYTYVPHYRNSPKDINSSISRDNIVTEPQRQRDSPKVITSTSTDNGDLFLNKEVCVKQAFQDPSESECWKEAMDKEFESLTSKTTGTLVPPPHSDQEIGGM